MRIRTKIMALLATVLLAGLILLGLFTRSLLTASADREAMRQAELMQSQVTGINEFVQRQVKPLLAGPSDHRFLPQTLMAWSVKTVFRNAAKQSPDYGVHQYMTNPTNPVDQAMGWQSDAIDVLTRTGEPRLAVKRETQEGSILSVATPIILTQEACLACHSSPAIAPAAMLENYGPDNGFGWTLNKVLGIQVIDVPMDAAQADARRTLEEVLGAAACVCLLTLIAFYLALGRLLGRSDDARVHA